MSAKRIVKRTEGSSRGLIDTKLLREACRIIAAEHTAAAQTESDLYTLSSDPFLHLNIIVSALPSVVNIRPVHIALKTPIHGRAFNTKVLLILTDEDYKARGKSLKEAIPNVRVTSYEKISRNFPEFKDKRDLLKRHDLFFCDERVYALLKKALGRVFYTRKRYPFPLSPAALGTSLAQLEAALRTATESGSYFYQGNGPEYSVRFARLSSSPTQIEANARAALKGALRVLLARGLRLSDVRRVVVKSDKSEAFPLYTYPKPAERRLLAEVLAAGRRESARLTEILFV